MKARIIQDPCSYSAIINLEEFSTPTFSQKFHQHQSNKFEFSVFSKSNSTPKNHPMAHPANSGSSTSSSREKSPNFFSFWFRISRIIFGKIKRLPRSMSTTLVLFTVHMYLTVPVIIICGVTGDCRALFRPFRMMKQQGFLFEELDEQFVEML